ncbi:hypothetical protein D3C80_1885520 [compost metagenome]
MPFAKPGDIGLVHGSCLNWVLHIDNHVHGTERRQSGQTVGDVDTIMHKLDCSETTMLVDGLSQLLETVGVFLVPYAALIGWRDI